MRKKHKAKGRKPQEGVTFTGKVILAGSAATIILSSGVALYMQATAENGATDMALAQGVSRYVGALGMGMAAFVAHMWGGPQATTHVPDIGQATSRPLCLTAYDEAYTRMAEKRQNPKLAMAFASSIEHIHTAQRLGHQVADTFGNEQNTFAHNLIANHDYASLIAIYKNLSEAERAAISCVKDFNGRTVFSLSLLMGAPPSMQQMLMTTDNVMVADDQDVTPLMWAAAGLVDPATLEIMLDMIGPSRIQTAYVERAMQYFSRLDADVLASTLLEQMNVYVLRAENACHDHFGSFSKEGPICAFEYQTRDDLLAAGFDIGPASIKAYAHKGQVCLTSSKNNLEKISQLAGEGYSDLKNRIEKETAYSVDPATGKRYTKEAEAARWKQHQKRAQDWLPEISERSWLDAIMANRKANNKLIEDYVSAHMPSAPGPRPS